MNIGAEHTFTPAQLEQLARASAADVTVQGLAQGLGTALMLGGLIWVASRVLRKLAVLTHREADAFVEQGIIVLLSIAGLAFFAWGTGVMPATPSQRAYFKYVAAADDLQTPEVRAVLADAKKSVYLSGGDVERLLDEASKVRLR